MITINPGTGIQGVINANPSETVFQIQNGLHRISSALTLRDGLTFQGESLAAILSGSVELHSSGDATDGSFTDAGGGRFRIGNQNHQGSVDNSGQCEVGFPECHQPEDLWIDEVYQIPQTNITDVDGPGKWHFDYTNNFIYIWASPANKQVETSKTQKAINTGGVDDVTLSTFTYEKFASPFQAAAIEADDGGQGWTATGLVMKQCHGQAMRVGQDWHVLNSRVTECGQLGLGGAKKLAGGVKCTGILVENCEIDNCGISGVNPGFAGGALKFTNTDNLIMRLCNVHDCPGNGIWMDIDNEEFTIDECTVTDIGYQGIFAEISFTGVISNCTVINCGHGRGNATGFGAGILNAATSDLEVFGNFVQDCHNGITGTQQDRGAGIKDGISTDYIIQNFFVHHNTVVLLQTGGDAQRVGLWTVFDPPGPDMYTGRNNRFVGNSYDLAGAVSNPFFWQDVNKTFAEWQAAGQDPPGPPTRFYFDSVATPSVSPTISATWDVVSAGARYRRMNRQKLGSAFANRNPPSGTTLGEDVLWHSFVYQGMPQMLLTGNFRGMIRCNQPNNNTDGRVQVRVLVTDSLGTTIRGVALEIDDGSDDPPTSEFRTNTMEARKVPRGWTGSGAALTSVQCQSGDCLVVELGWRHMEAGTVRSCPLETGDPITSSDIPELETSTAQAAGWFEFTATINAGTAVTLPAVAVGVATLTPKQVASRLLAATAVGVAGLATQFTAAPAGGNPTRPKQKGRHHRRRGG